MTTPAYALSDFDINGIIIQARPTGWDGEDVDGFGNDISGNQVYPTTWITTCPHCGNMVEIKKEEVYVSEDNTEFCTRCDSCETGKVLKKLQFGSESDIPDTAIFLDPIEAGLFSIAHDGALLKQLDEDLAKSL